MQASLHSSRGMEWRHQQPSPSPSPMPLPLGNQSPFQMNAAAQEVCVIQRTVRQETMAATNLINFGGLEGGIMFKQQQLQQQGHQSNQLLALVQPAPQELYPSSAPMLPPRSSSLPSAPYFGDASVKGPRTSSFGRVSTVDIHGLPVYGELLLTDKAPRFDARLEIICCCCGFHLPVSKFVQHINASHGMNPGSVVYMESGQTLLQWRKSLFARLEVKIDDDAGWDWNDANGSDAARSSRNFDLDYSGYVNSQLSHPPVAPAALNYSNHQFQALHRRSTSQSSHFTREHIAAASKPTSGFLNQSSSEYFDFINPGGNRGYASAPAEQQQQQIGVGEKFRRAADHGLGELRPDVSSIELRLGQPSQQAHQTKPFEAFRSQYQLQALEPSLHHDYTLNAHQASATQQQRLDKVVNFNQFGSTGLERTLFCERTKLWTDSAGQAIQNEASRVTLEAFTPSQPEYPLEHMIKRVAAARQLHNMNPGPNQIDLSFAQHQQQQPLGSSHTTSWTLSSSRLEGGIWQCSEKAYSPGAAEVVPCYGRRGAGEAYRQQQQHVVDLTGSLLDDRDSVRIVEVRNNAAPIVDLTEYNAPEKGKNRLLVSSETSPALEKRSCDEHQAALVEGNRPAEFSNVGRADEGGMPLDNGGNDYSVGQVLDHNDDTALPASSGALVSVGENEFPVSRGHFSGPVSQPFEWKAPAKSAPIQAVEQKDDYKEADDEKSAATADERSSKEGDLLSDVSTKSSENVLSGFSDARHLNEETSTLESGSQKRDVVDEGSGIEKCSSDEQCFGDKTTSAEPRHSAVKRDSSSAEASSSMLEKLPESAGVEEDTVAEEEDTVDERKRRRSTKWKSVNTATMSDSETSKKTPRQPRYARASNRRSKKPQRFEAVATAALKGPSTRAAGGKMMSIRAIMENSGSALEAPAAAAGAATLPKQARKRKLSELSTQACPALSNGPLPAVIPRGERSPRRGAGARKAGAAKEHEAVAAGMTKVPKRKRDFEVVEDVEPGAAKRKSSRYQQPHSCVDALPAAGTEKVKWKSLQNDSFDDKSPSTKAKSDKAKGSHAQDSCSVCGSSSAESHNQLVKCSSCSIKVHQACYGVPKVPKSWWSCRPCKSNSANIACVLCGHGGGALTRAQQTRAAVQDLLKVWNAKASTSRGVRRSSRNLKGREGEEISNSVTASLGDPNAEQWVHMVCALWMPGTRCLNMETMSSFDVSGVSAARRRLTCSLCKRGGGSCIQCNEPRCAVPFHPWCAHVQGLLQIETVNDTGGHVRFHGKCPAHHAPPPDASRRASKCSRTQKPAR